MRYLLTITYNGEGFCGWQKQKNGRSIQEEIESALFVLLKEKVNLVASGRTDAKVNAYKQKAHFDCETVVKNISRFLYSLNSILPKEVKVLEMEESELHARFSAKNKTYLYKMYKSEVELPFKNLELRVDKDVDVELMQKCAQFLVGEHDFKNFCASGSEIESTVRTIYSLDIIEHGQDVELYVCGNGFLYKMVRNIVGLLLEVGKGKISIDEFKDFAFGDKIVAKKTAPPYALYLYDVVYR